MKNGIPNCFCKGMNKNTGGGGQGRQPQAITLRSPSLLLNPPPPPSSREHQWKKLRDQIGYKMQMFSENCKASHK